MRMDGLKTRQVPLAKIAVHPEARFAFRFTQALVPQCNISLVSACYTGTWSPMFPIVVKVESLYLVVGGWQGLLFSGEIEDKIYVVVLKSVTNEEVRKSSLRFAVSMLLSQIHKNRHNGAIAELAEHRPELLSSPVFNKTFETPRSLSYSLAPIDPKSVDKQRDRINEERLDRLRSKK